MLLPILLLAFQTATPPVTIWPHGIPPEGSRGKQTYTNHSLSVSIHGNKSLAEVHESTATIMVAQTGQADLIYGGQLVAPHRLSPTELRGASIRNGTRVHISPGDVIHFSAGVPHQWIVAPGVTITFLVIHINQPVSP
jgi:uncharacterized RmlC-like cupin family protein